MTLILTRQPVATTGLALAPTPQHRVRRSVAVVIDAWCELAPGTLRELELMVLPCTIGAGRGATQLDSARTLHPDCWPEQRPRGLLPQPGGVASFAAAFDAALGHELSVLSLHPPRRLSPAATVATHARSVLMAGQRSHSNPAPRIAVYELGVVGAAFDFALETAARVAAAGWSLSQILALLDRVQADLVSQFVSSGAPVSGLQVPGRRWPQLPGRTRLYNLDPSRGLLLEQAGAADPRTRLFEAGQPLGGPAPSVVRSSDERLLAQLNAGREAAGLPALEPQRGGISLGAIFPRGCVELAQLPSAEHLARIGALIQHITPQTPAQPRGVAQRGGL